MITLEELLKLQEVAKYAKDGGDMKTSFNCATWYRFVTGINASIIPTCESGNSFEIMQTISEGKRFYTILDNPINGCIVALKKLRHYHHVGVWIDGYVWHMDKQGLLCSSLISLKSNGYEYEFGELKNG